MYSEFVSFSELILRLISVFFQFNAKSGVPYIRENGVYEAPWDVDSGARDDRHGYIYGRL